MAFLLATVIAGLTGLSYAQLAGRLPFSAGEAVYVDEAFHKGGLTLLIGLAVAASGILSAATIAHGFAGYLNVLVSTPVTLTALAYLIVLALVAISGIRETAWVVGIIAATSTLGLIVLGGVIVYADADWRWPDLDFSFSAVPLAAVLMGAFLAFYALIGFEDLVNLAEEIETPGRTLGIAIPVSLIFSSLLYIGLAIVALGAVSVDDLAASNAPIAFMLNSAGLQGTSIVVLLSIVAITEGALAQLVMSSRVLYGLAGRGMLPARLATVNPRTRTPVIASLIVLGLVMLAAWSGGVLSLARGTSALVLTVFTVVNISLLVLNWKSGERSIMRNVIPVLGALSCLLLLVVEVMRVTGHSIILGGG